MPCRVVSMACASIVAEIVTLPFCTLKTNVQTSAGSARRNLHEILRTRGVISGLFGAAPFAVAGQVLSTTSKYGLYEWFKKQRGTEDAEVGSNALNGAASGILGGILTHPCDVAKMHRQRGVPLDLHTHGVGVLWRGLGQTCLKNLTLYTFLFPVYDFHKTRTRSPLIAAALTSTCITSVLQPLEFWRTRRIAGQNFEPSACLRGFGLALTRNVTHFCLTMTVAEFLTAQCSQR